MAEAEEALCRRVVRTKLETKMRLQWLEVIEELIQRQKLSTAQFQLDAFVRHINATDETGATLPICAKAHGGQNESD